MWSAESVRDVDAPTHVVWQLYVHPATWPVWAHSTTAASSDGALAVGSRVLVRPHRGPTQRVRITTLEPERLLTSEIRLPGARMAFRYEIEPVATRCRVRHRVEMTGPLSGVYGLVMHRSNARKLTRETARLAEVAKAAADARAYTAPS